MKILNLFRPSRRVQFKTAKIDKPRKPNEDKARQMKKTIDSSCALPVVSRRGNYNMPLFLIAFVSQRNLLSSPVITLHKDDLRNRRSHIYTQIYL